MHHEITGAGQRLVHRVVHDLETAERQSQVGPQVVVVVAGQEHDAGAALHLLAEQAQDVAVPLGPTDAFTKAPQIEDVADEIDGLGIIAIEKFGEAAHVREARTEVHIGNEKASVGKPAGCPCHGGVFHHRSHVLGT